MVSTCRNSFRGVSTVLRKHKPFLGKVWSMWGTECGVHVRSTVKPMGLCAAKSPPLSSIASQAKPRVEHIELLLHSTTELHILHSFPSILI